MDCDNVVYDLKQIARFYGTKHVALIRYERPDQFCHRQLVAEWLLENGWKCQEWGYGE